MPLQNGIVHLPNNLGILFCCGSVLLQFLTGAMRTGGGTWSAGQSISIAVISTWSMLDGKVVSLRQFMPSCQLSLLVLEVQQPSKSGMVSAHCDSFPIEVWMKVFYGFDHSQELLSSSTVVFLRLAEGLAVVCYDFLLAILNLREHSSKANVTGICVNNKMSLFIGVPQYWCCN